jgi:hypothetical protein
VAELPSYTPLCFLFRSVVRGVRQAHRVPRRRDGLLVLTAIRARLSMLLFTVIQWPGASSPGRSLWFRSTAQVPAAPAEIPGTQRGRRRSLSVPAQQRKLPQRCPGRLGLQVL